jgi:hypothetical protein
MAAINDWLKGASGAYLLRLRRLLPKTNAIGSTNIGFIVEGTDQSQPMAQP